MALIFRFKCTSKHRLLFVSIWTSLKFCSLVMGYGKELKPMKKSRSKIRLHVLYILILIETVQKSAQSEERFLIFHHMTKFQIDLNLKDLQTTSVNQNMKFVLLYFGRRIKSWLHAFLLFPQCFLKPYPQGHKKLPLCGEGLTFDQTTKCQTCPN